MRVNPNKNKMNTNGIMRYVFNIFSPFSNDDCSSSKPSRIVGVCWTYYITGEGYLQEFFGAKIGGQIISFLGYSFEPKGLSIAPKTLANFLESITQLYEQGADGKRIGQYVRNWGRWVSAGVEISVINVFPDASVVILRSGKMFITQTAPKTRTYSP